MLVDTQEKMDRRRSKLDDEKLEKWTKKYKETKNFYYITLMDREFGNLDYLATDWGNEIEQPTYN